MHLHSSEAFSTEQLIKMFTAPLQSAPSPSLNGLDQICLF